MKLKSIFSNLKGGNMSKTTQLVGSFVLVVAAAFIMWLWLSPRKVAIEEAKPAVKTETKETVTPEKKDVPTPAVVPATDPADGCSMVPLKSPGEFVAVCTRRICTQDKPSTLITQLYTNWDSVVADFALKTPAGVACAQGACPTAQWAPADHLCPLFVLTGTLRMLPPKQPATPELVPVTPTPKKTLPKK